MELLVKILCCMLLLVQLGDGQEPTNRPSNGVQLYLPYENRTIPDFSMIHDGQTYDIDQHNNGTNNALWCQSANNGSDIGLWYYPNGTQVPLFTGAFDDISAPSPIFSKRLTGQIALARKAGLSGYEGLYTCIIPDENRVNQILVVGIYRTVTYNSNDGPDADSSMQFSLISTRDANPPVFTLTFNVSNEPPTYVNCTDGSNPFTIASGDLSRVVVNGPESITQVTVTVRMRQAGTYQCSVSNARMTGGPENSSKTATNSNSTSQPITVTGTPTDLNATRLNTGLTHIQLSWSSVSGVAGYEVFYQLSNYGSSVMSAGTTTNTTLNITSGLCLNNRYIFFVVSYGSEDSTVLPSDHSNTTNVTLSDITVHLSTVTVTVISTTSYEGSCPIFTMTTTNTESSTSGLTVSVSSILVVVVLVITGIIIITLVLVVIKLYNKIQLLSMKTRHRDIVVTTSPDYRAVETSIHEALYEITNEDIAMTTSPNYSNVETSVNEALYEITNEDIAMTTSPNYSNVEISVYQALHEITNEDITKTTSPIYSNVETSVHEALYEMTNEDITMTTSPNYSNVETSINEALNEITNEDIAMTTSPNYSNVEISVNEALNEITNEDIAMTTSPNYSNVETSVNEALYEITDQELCSLSFQ